MSDSKQPTFVRNQDNDGLGPKGNELIVIGSVEAVNGPGATEVRDLG